jgi:rod shape-determining protein MreD
MNPVIVAVPPARRIRLALALLAAFILDTAFGRTFEIYGARPNFGLVTLLIACLYVDSNLGAWLGFGLGLLEASYASRYVGSLIVSRSLPGFFVGMLEERIFRDSVFVALLVVLLGTATVEGLFFIFAPQPHVVRYFTRAGTECLLNASAALPVYYGVRRLARGRKG